MGAKIEYASCLRAEEAKYHRYCMQRFLNGKPLVESFINKRNLNEDKNRLFEEFCKWYENTQHDESSAFTLFDVQKRMMELSGSDEVYTIKQISRKLKKRYGEKVQFATCDGRPSIMLLRDEVDHILMDSLMDNSSCDTMDFLNIWTFKQNKRGISLDAEKIF